MVKISNHIIIIHLVDVILHIYNTLDQIRVALVANWESTSVMVRIDPNPTSCTKGAPTKPKQSRNLI